MPDFLGQAKVGANGQAVVNIGHNLPNFIWEVSQVTTNVGPASKAGNVGIFLNNNLVAPTSALTPQVSPSGAATIGQTAAGLPYIYLFASDQLQVVISSAVAGDMINIRAQYRELRQDHPQVIGV